MPVSEEQFREMESRVKRNTKRVMDAMATLDVDAVAEGEEIALHMEIIKECRRRGWMYVYHDPSRRTGATLGTPDFIIYANSSRVFNIECKTRAGRLSKDQKNFQDALYALQHNYHEVKSFKRFLEIIK